ncbi:uncharacterized protein H6S33_008075 [Morchella sextelata]|uniref:uncharacterized protein n=1 Tax=Morchella sextelata TaxID=1174677 RepID=UPI001D051594|nr:uncharacterized protein H6S33_008075 [Morchella sextelata]KAH0603071.1 hypothetical protein H6S33_008075 [Morchella sextelata]
MVDDVVTTNNLILSLRHELGFVISNWEKVRQGVEADSSHCKPVIHGGEDKYPVCMTVGWSFNSKHCLRIGQNTPDSRSSGDVGGTEPHEWPMMMQGSKHSAQPGNAADMQGAKPNSTIVSSASGGGVSDELSDRTLRPHTKPAEYRFVYRTAIDTDFNRPSIHRTANAATNSAPSPPTGPTSAAITRHHTVDAATQTPPSPRRGPTGPTSAVIARRHIANAATNTSPPPPDSTAATTARRPTADTATVFLSTGRDHAVASSICNLSERPSGAGKTVTEEVEEGRMVMRWRGEVGDEGGGRAGAGGGGEETGGEEEDYATPKG